MSLLKSALRTDTVRGGLCALAALYIRVVRAAGREADRLVGRHPIEPAAAADGRIGAP